MSVPLVLAPVSFLRVFNEFREENDVINDGSLSGATNLAAATNIMHGSAVAPVGLSYPLLFFFVTMRGCRLDGVRK